MNGSGGGQATASLPTDLENRKRSFAQDIFPGEKYENVADRMSTRDGRVAYRDNDGATYYAEPSLRAPTSVNNLAADAKYAAGFVGPAIPYATAAAEEAVFGPLGAGPLAAIGGAAVGMKARQDLAQRYGGAVYSPDQRMREVGNSMIEQGTEDAMKNTLKAMKLWPFKYFP